MDQVKGPQLPGEPTGYRQARGDLLEAERELRAQIERVSALRRSLPLGGRVADDYAFSERVGEEHRTVRLSDLFQTGNSLIVYSFMYGPEMEQPCPMCTSMLDGLDGQAPHIAQSTNLVVIAKSPIARIRSFGAERGWRNLRLLSSEGTTYNRDYLAETAEGNQMPMLNVFARRDDGIFHFYGTELLYAPCEPGQNARHVDLLWPLWHALDLTPEGRGVDWYPSLQY